MIGILMCQPYTRWLGANIIDDRPACEEFHVIGRTAWMSAALAERLRLMTLTPTFVSLGAQTLGTYLGW